MVKLIGDYYDRKKNKYDDQSRFQRLLGTTYEAMAYRSKTKFILYPQQPVGKAGVTFTDYGSHRKIDMGKLGTAINAVKLAENLGHQSLPEYLHHVPDKCLTERHPKNTDVPIIGFAHSSSYYQCGRHFVVYRSTSYEITRWEVIVTKSQNAKRRIGDHYSFHPNFLEACKSAYAGELVRLRETLIEGDDTN